MQIVLHVLVEMVGYTVARLALPLLSFGRVYVAPLASPAEKFNLIGYRRDERGRIEIDTNAAGSVGVIMCLIGAFGIAFAIRAII